MKKMSVASYYLFKRDFDAETVYSNYSRFLQEMVRDQRRDIPKRSSVVIK